VTKVRKKTLSLKERLWFLKSAVQVLFQRTIETYDFVTGNKITKPFPIGERLSTAWACLGTFLLGYVYELDEAETVTTILGDETSCR